jgi:hypothetical protein
MVQLRPLDVLIVLRAKFTTVRQEVKYPEQGIVICPDELGLSKTL